jgi:uncharacterized protein
MSSRFEICIAPTNQIQWKLMNSEKQAVLTSQGFPNKDACLENVRAIKENAMIEQRYEKKSLEGKFTFKLKAANHKPLVGGGPYESELVRDQAIQVLRGAAQSAVIDLVK